MGALLVMEGVTGAGKTSTIAAMRARCDTEGTRLEVVDEDVTLGTFLDDVRDPQWRRQPRFPGLDAGLADANRLRARDPHALVVLERFHLSAYALLPRWASVARYDRALAALGALQVLLDFAPREAEARAILRPDRDGWAGDMDTHYGSRREAIGSVLRSQAMRRRALLLSELPYLHMSTGDADWDARARAVLAFARRETP